MIMCVCVHFLNQRLGSAEASAVFASSQITHILTPIPASSVQRKPINISNSEKSTFPAPLVWLANEVKVLAVDFGLR